LENHAVYKSRYVCSSAFIQQSFDVIAGSKITSLESSQFLFLSTLHISPRKAPTTVSYAPYEDICAMHFSTSFALCFALVVTPSLAAPSLANDKAGFDIAKRDATAGFTLWTGFLW